MVKGQLDLDLKSRGLFVYLRMVKQNVLRLLVILVSILFSPGGNSQEKFSAEVLELQGVWSLSEDSPEKLNFAKLIVHGSYFLLIYEWPERDAKEYELMKFKADGSQILDAEGNRWFNYVVHGKQGKQVNFEIRDERNKPISKYTEVTLTRIGVLPDLNLKPGSE